MVIFQFELRQATLLEVLPCHGIASVQATSVAKESLVGNLRTEKHRVDDLWGLAPHLSRWGRWDPWGRWGRWGDGDVSIPDAIDVWNMFTYIWASFGVSDAKCRYIFHTWSIWESHHVW